MEAMAATVHYKYRPLRHPDAIRLCRVLPHSDDVSSIQISLSSYRLSDRNLDFTALSYTWGDPSDKVPISLGRGGAILQVPRSSVEALTVLRLQRRRQLFWIDAICIDQDNLQEKTLQVRMMGRIYTKASFTTIYLGPHTESSKVVFQEVLEAQHGPQTTNKHGGIIADRDCPNDVIVRGLEELIQRPWFRRVWVLQEAYLGRNIQVLCGDDVVAKKTLMECFFGYRDSLVMKVEVPFAFRTDIMRPRIPYVLWYTLWDCLSWTRDSLATDPRDRLFALRAFFEQPEEFDTDPFMDHFDQLINYERSLEDIFMTVASYFLQFIGLKLLVGARHGHSRQMPSWVPDWSQNLPLSRLFFTFTYRGMEEEYVKFLKRALSKVYKPPDPRLLMIEVWLCSPIHEMGETYFFNDFDDAKCQISYLISVITTESSGRRTRANSSKVGQAGLSFNVFEVLRRLQWSQIATLLTRNSIFPTDPTNIGDESMGYMMRALQGCRFALCGPSYVAVAPRSAKLGDLLVLVAGAYVPCLIRPASNRNWSLISGDCFALSLDPLRPLKNHGAVGADTRKALIHDLGGKPRYTVYDKAVPMLEVTIVGITSRVALPIIEVGA